MSIAIFDFDVSSSLTASTIFCHRNLFQKLGRMVRLAALPLLTAGTQCNTRGRQLGDYQHLNVPFGCVFITRLLCHPLESRDGTHALMHAFTRCW